MAGTSAVLAPLVIFTFDGWGTGEHAGVVIWFGFVATVFQAIVWVIVFILAVYSDLGTAHYLLATGTYVVAVAAITTAVGTVGRSMIR